LEVGLYVLRDHGIRRLGGYLRESNLLVRLVNHLGAGELPGVFLQFDDEWLLARGSLYPELFDVCVFTVYTGITSNVFDRSALPYLFMVELDLLGHFFKIQFEPKLSRERGWGPMCDII
jgi:hypothetical protein